MEERYMEKISLIVIHFWSIVELLVWNTRADIHLIYALKGANNKRAADTCRVASRFYCPPMI